MNVVYVFILALVTGPIFGQVDLEIQFIPLYNNEVLTLDHNYFDKSISDSIKFTKLKFYVSQVELEIGESTQSLVDHFLFDIEKKTKIQKEVEVIDSYGTLSFILGVDSLTNTGGPKSGDLDPINGMYWAWQSGFINFKIEGKSPVCESRGNIFQYHVGGFLAPNQTERKISGRIDLNQDVIKIYIPIDFFIALQDLKLNHTVMSPGSDAVSLANQLKSIFYTK